MEIIVKSKVHGDKIVVIDKQDYDNLNGRKICLAYRKKSQTFYATTRYNGKCTMLHRLIMNFPKSDIDHKDRNGLNNSRNNLRIATKSENGANKTKTKRSRSKYKGVYKHSQCDKFRVQFMCGKKLINGGYFINENEAALKYNELALIHFGDFAFLNEVDEINKTERFGKIRTSNSTGYKGVFLDKKKKNKSYFAKVAVNRKQYSKFGFDNPKDAAMAYNDLAKKHFGENALLNIIPNE